MKKKLAQFFLLVSKFLCAEVHVENYQHVEDYEARVIGISFIATKAQINDLRLRSGESKRECDRIMVSRLSQEVRDAIIRGIDKHNLIDYEVKNKDGGLEVVGKLRVYVRKKESDIED